MMAVVIVVVAKYWYGGSSGLGGGGNHETVDQTSLQMKMGDSSSWTSLSTSVRTSTVTSRSLLKTCTELRSCQLLIYFSTFTLPINDTRICK